MVPPSDLKARIEALVFAADRPLSPSDLIEALAEATPSTLAEVTEALTGLRSDYEERRGGLKLVEVAGGWELRTQERFAADILRLYQRRPSKLSQAAKEALAIIAYRQPCTRALIDQIRGVDSSAAIRTLLQHDLITPSGRAKLPGNPFLYKTSRQFLRVFGLASLSDLPDASEARNKVQAEIVLLDDYRTLETAEAADPGSDQNEGER